MKGILVTDRNGENDLGQSENGKKEHLEKKEEKIYGILRYITLG